MGKFLESGSLFTNHEGFAAVILYMVWPDQCQSLHGDNGRPRANIKTEHHNKSHIYTISVTVLQITHLPQIHSNNLQDGDIPINQSINQSINPSINHSVNQSINQSINQSYCKQSNKWTIEAMNQPINCINKLNKVVDKDPIRSTSWPFSCPVLARAQRAKARRITGSRHRTSSRLL